MLPALVTRHTTVQNDERQERKIKKSKFWSAWVNRVVQSVMSELKFGDAHRSWVSTLHPAALPPTLHREVSGKHCTALSKAEGAHADLFIKFSGPPSTFQQGMSQ